jgi:hypothetical protein
MLACSDPDVFLDPEGDKVPPDSLPAEFWNGVSALVNGRAWTGRSERAGLIVQWLPQGHNMDIVASGHGGHFGQLVLAFCFDPATATPPYRSSVHGYWRTFARVKPPTISNEEKFYSISSLPEDSIVIEAFHFPDLIRGSFHIVAKSTDGFEVRLEGKFYGGVGWGVGLYPGCN